MIESYNQNSIQSCLKSTFDCLLDWWHAYTSVTDSTYLESIRFTRNIEAFLLTVKGDIKLFSKGKASHWKDQGDVIAMWNILDTPSI